MKKMKKLIAWSWRHLVQTLAVRPDGVRRRGSSGLFLEELEGRCTPTNLFWNPIGGVTGNYSTLAHWNQDRVGGPAATAIPGPNDTANFTIAATCNVDVNVVVNDLEVSNGTFSIIDRHIKQ